MIITLKNVFFSHLDWSPRFYHNKNTGTIERSLLIMQREPKWYETALIWVTLPILIWNILQPEMMGNYEYGPDPTFIVPTGPRRPDF